MKTEAAVDNDARQHSTSNTHCRCSTMSLAITRKSNTTVTMMAEKISGHILNKTLLPQSDVKFYKAVLWV